MECTIKSSGVSRWSCTVSTREENGATTPFSPVLINKADVELWIRRAQAAMLCPNLPSVTFERKDRDEIKEITDTKKHPEVLTVTANKVVIDIDDPDGANLAFVDLPGMSRLCADYHYRSSNGSRRTCAERATRRDQTHQGPGGGKHFFAVDHHPCDDTCQWCDL